MHRTLGCGGLALVAGVCLASGCNLLFPFQSNTNVDGAGPRGDAGASLDLKVDRRADTTASDAPIGLACRGYVGRTITIHSSQVSGVAALPDFPLLVTLADDASLRVSPGPAHHCLAAGPRSCSATTDQLGVRLRFRRRL